MERRNEERWRREHSSSGKQIKMSICIIDSFVDETFAVRLQPNSVIHLIIWFGKERSCKT